MEIANRPRLLVFNCHEAWVHQLNVLDYDLDIICGLPGRYTPGWDTHVRPVPARGRIISLDEARTRARRYACIIAHNPTDLLDVKERPEPRLLVHHLPVEARIIEERSRLSAAEARDLLHRYAQLSGTHVMAVSHLKGNSWGTAGDIVPFGVDPGDYGPCSGEIPCGLRIANFIQRRRTFLHWDFHEQAFAGTPVRIVGHNPGLAGAAPSRDWDHLKDLLRTHRFYIHTAHPELEDGFNMATVEAMAAGLPVLGNRHPTSVVEHGVNGFVSDDPAELRRYARLLLDDRKRALRMGEAARTTVQRRFSVAAFRSNMERAIQSARRKRASLPAQEQPVRPRPRIVELPPESGPKASRSASRALDPQRHASLPPDR
ncbi:MAG: glycosyltransferase family 4 protein [Sedimentisphaerales bacterium]|nr:glycosyltransferase family 4 protein [Sedimentisphaerales bacterium]